jgi:ZIP family zinc transporter
MFPIWLQASFWGLVAGSALLLGACLGYFLKISQRAISFAGALCAIAAIMAFGAGVLISALSFELMDEVDLFPQSSTVVIGH